MRSRFHPWTWLGGLVWVVPVGSVYPADPTVVEASPHLSETDDSPRPPSLQTPGPWRAAAAVRSPEWIDFGATHRTRYGSLWNQFVAGASGHDQLLSLRTTAWAELKFAPIVIGGEFIDSRIYLADGNTPVDTGLVNPVELLRAYAGTNLPHLFVRGAMGKIRAGRLTMDVGSRRFVARNRFRNTINTLTGIDFEWTGPKKDSVRLFLTLPVRRRPTTRDDLVENRIEFDRENPDALFWGAWYGSRPMWKSLIGELYVFGLHEQDSAEVASANRQLLTPGFRLFRKAGPGQWDGELEGAIQVGTSRSSGRADDRTDLNHLAFFAHVGFGYTFDTWSAPRLLVQYDYASGDADPTDGDNGRFDSLFGVPRFDFGPTSIYGAFARSNVNSPGAVLELAPLEEIEAFIGYRAVWLAQARDAWTTSGVQDPSGESGTFLGNQLECRIRLRLLPGNVLLETGFAHTWLGRFGRSAPNANGTGDPTYVYTQLVLEI